MLTHFICPDEQAVPLVECLAVCRLGRRCLSLATLRQAAQDRPWTGEPSVTQLLNGTMQEYLKITKEYAIRPMSRAFALLGTEHHARLAEMAYDSDSITEELFSGGDIKGHPDLLAPCVICEDCGHVTDL